jgi:hypothetical protein
MKLAHKLSAIATALAVAAIPLTTPTLAQTNGTLYAQAANLRNANISFHTNDEDKDHDTHVTAVVKDCNNVVVARISNDFGHFNDNSDAGPYALRVTNSSSKTCLQKGFVTVRVDPNGHDTWRFNFFLDLQFADGSHLSGNVDGLSLSHNNRQQTFGLDGAGFRDN